MSKLKEYFAKKKKYKELEKAAKKRAKEFDKEIEKEYKEKYLKKDHENISNKLAKKMAEFFDILWPDDEEQIDKEYEEYLTDQEKEDIEEMKKDEKKTLRKVFLSYAGIVAMTVVIVITASYLAQSHYKKVIVPMIKEYFKTHYNKEIDVDSNSFVCYEVKDEQGSTKEECTNILVTTTKDKNHVITIDDKYVGDDMRTESFVTSYEATFEKTFSDIGIVAQETTLSYQDYYHDYNEHLDYIKVLPIDVKFDDLYKSKKLTVVGRVLYQNEINLDVMQSYIKTFGSNSKIFFIKVSQGLPSKISVVTQEDTFTANITNSLSLENFITYYEIDRTYNTVNSCTKTDVSTHGIGSSYSNTKYDDTEYKYDNAKYFEIDYDRDTGSYWGEEEEEPKIEKKNYYLLKYTNGYFPGKYILFKGSKGNYVELDKEEYPTFEVLHLGNETYVISDSSFGIATKTEKKQGFLCIFGLC